MMCLDEIHVGVRQRLLGDQGTLRAVDQQVVAVEPLDDGGCLLDPGIGRGHFVSGLPSEDRPVLTVGNPGHGVNPMDEEPSKSRIVLDHFRIGPELAGFLAAEGRQLGGSPPPAPLVDQGDDQAHLVLVGRRNHPVKGDERFLVELAGSENMPGHVGGIVGLPDRQGVHAHDLPAKLGDRLQGVVDLVVAGEAKRHAPVEPHVVLDVVQIRDVHRDKPEPAIAVLQHGSLASDKVLEALLVSRGKSRQGQKQVEYARNQVPFPCHGSSPIATAGRFVASTWAATRSSSSR